MIKRRTKRVLNSIKEFLTGETFKIILIGLSIGIAGIACFWAYIMTVFTNDLVEKVQLLEDENTYLKEDVGDCGIDANYYRMLYEEMEDTLRHYQENNDNE